MVYAMKHMPMIVGLAAVVMYVISYQKKNRRGIVICGATSRALYVIQYLLLGALSGAVLDIIGTVASILAGRKHSPLIRKNLRLILVLLNLSMIIAGALLYENIFSLFPVLGVMLQTGAFWLEDEKNIRRMSLAGCPFWLSYNIISGAYGSVVGDILSIISLTVAIFRYDIPRKK